MLREIPSETVPDYYSFEERPDEVAVTYRLVDPTRRGRGASAAHPGAAHRRATRGGPAVVAGRSRRVVHGDGAAERHDADAACVADDGFRAPIHLLGEIRGS